MKANAMKFIFFAIVLTMSFAQAATALETSANVRDVEPVSGEIRINAESAALSAAITKVNKDIVAVLKCNKLNKFYKPDDSTADGNGCVGVTVTTTTTNHTDNLSNLLFNSYPNQSKNSKGYIGTSTRTISLAGIVADGAKSISVKGTLGGFTGGCSNVSGASTMNIANVNTSIGTSEFRCHYDSSPNRSSYFLWSYNGSNKVLSVTAKMSQTSSPMTSARITGVTATYSLTKTVLKIGNGK